MPDANLDNVGCVVIGRNEGDRLIRCLASVRSISKRVYVDSGSSDDSVAAAVRDGTSVIELDIPPDFTAARARNAGLAKLLAENPSLEFIQTVDGDCEIDGGWIAAGLSALRAESGLAGVFGRLHERYPKRSVYNAICDDDWNVPIGETTIIGGVALLRVSVLREVGLYNANMIAGEEPDLAMRMRGCGWRLRRIDAAMGFHDVDITRFSQWWTRTRRTGHAYAELAYRYPDGRASDWPRTALSIIFWGGGMPLALAFAVALACFAGLHWWIVAGAIFLVWPIRMVQIAKAKLSRGLPLKVCLAAGATIMIGKIPQFLGLLEYHRNRVVGRSSRIIEHKGPPATL
jgi:glycosyltransferase involved in cell wall biosynthesis